LLVPVTLVGLVGRLVDRWSMWSPCRRYIVAVSGHW